jgi:hypothetical protein
MTAGPNLCFLVTMREPRRVPSVPDLVADLSRIEDQQLPQALESTAGADKEDEKLLLISAAASPAACSMFTFKQRPPTVIVRHFLLPVFLLVIPNGAFRPAPRNHSVQGEFVQKEIQEVTS